MKPALVASSTANAGQVRVLSLQTSDFDAKPEVVNGILMAPGIVAGPWQVITNPQSQLPNRWAVSTYYLAGLFSQPKPEPIGILLISQRKCLLLPDRDFSDLQPKRNQPDPRANPQFIQSWAGWNAAWRHAGEDWSEALSNFDRNLVRLKRRGQVPLSPPPQTPHLGRPSIESGNLPGLEYSIRGILH
jgi:hypothetical protein